ncbi:MAG: hypothetical protein ABIH67_05335 [Candidatus Uhrbacteria bacterium]
MLCGGLFVVQGQQQKEEEIYDGPMTDTEEEIYLSWNECYVIRISSVTEQERENSPLCEGGGNIGLSFQGAKRVAVKDTEVDPPTIVATFYNGTVTYTIHPLHPYAVYSVDTDTFYNNTLILFTTRDPGVDYKMPPVGGDEQ